MSANMLEILITMVIPSVAICFVLVITFANIYLNIRRRFPAKVNCWFCNRDTCVPYDESNSFVCPTCTQYNGFTADGDYNREIPEQYQAKLNRDYCVTPLGNITDDDKWGNAKGFAASSTQYNGLCFGCNRNQELKMHQLASFVPEDESNYDFEVEEYRKQLEQAYKLCGRCERVLKRTLNDVKRNILGSKLAQIGSKGLSVLDMHMRASTKQIARMKRQRWARFCVYAVTLLLVIKLPQEFADAGWHLVDLIQLCPAPLLTGLTVALSYMLTMRQVVQQQFTKLLTEPAIQQTTERMDALGRELMQKYAPELMSTSSKCFDTLGEHVSNEQRTHLLLNVAIMALAALLVSLGSQRMAIRQITIIVLGVVDCVLKYNYQRMDTGLYFSLAALGLSVSCLGQQSIRGDVAGGDLNSSFHKIYSQQCSESDYSDVDTTYSENHSMRNCVQGGKISPNQRTVTLREVADLSHKSLDTTKSLSPSAYSLSPTNAFFFPDYRNSGSHSPSVRAQPSDKVSGSLFNIPDGARHESAEANSVFNRSTVATASSLLKTPSFSVDDFSRTAQLIGNRREPELGFRGVPNPFHRSMSTIRRKEPCDDPLIEDDIDRLSISGRASLNTSRTSNNPFAQFDVDTGPLSVVRRRRIAQPLEPFPTVSEESIWPKRTPTGNASSVLGGQTHMSRTSSQSSGFESQSATRRNTPTEVEPLAVGTGPEVVHEPATVPSPSPVPSSASVLQRNHQPASPWYGARVSLPMTSPPQHHHRSLFSEQSLFKNAFQQPQSGAPNGLFFPRLSLAGAGGPGSTTSSNASSASHVNMRHIFPPQQSQTPSYHYQHQLGAGGRLPDAGFP
ncbi:uncharacterized protein LOC131212471 [Anopheles bellator]|uniref:uncharacterized protein LOC131212471 n=1 Tax=Anopheles bellator TaxID=139047 RepID=UPI002647602E|nr:uncharacterized protein LOC131212471 [Anopheles bellator]